MKSGKETHNNTIKVSGQFSLVLMVIITVARVVTLLFMSFGLQYVKQYLLLDRHFRDHLTFIS